MSQQSLEARARRLARHLGLRIEKSRTRKHFHINDHGHYRIINDDNIIVEGEHYDMELPEVMEFLLEQ